MVLYKLRQAGSISKIPSISLDAANKTWILNLTSFDSSNLHNFFSRSDTGEERELGNDSLPLHQRRLVNVRITVTDSVQSSRLHKHRQCAHTNFLLFLIILDDISYHGSVIDLIREDVDGRNQCRMLFSSANRSAKNASTSAQPFATGTPANWNPASSVQ